MWGSAEVCLGTFVEALATSVPTFIVTPPERIGRQRCSENLPPRAPPGEFGGFWRREPKPVHNTLPPLLLVLKAGEPHPIGEHSTLAPTLLITAPHVCLLRRSCPRAGRRRRVPRVRAPDVGRFGRRGGPNP